VGSRRIRVCAVASDGGATKANAPTMTGNKMVNLQYTVLEALVLKDMVLKDMASSTI
jgi:hypothetical protein